MSTYEQLQLAPIPTSIDNLDGWEAIAAQVSSQAGVAPVVTPDLVAGMIGSAVPLLFEADAAENAIVLRGTFAGPVIAQCQRNAGCLEGGQPTSAAVHLVGAHMTDGRLVVRAHLRIQVHGSDGSPSVSSQFWDLQLGGQVTVGQPNCPNCGAPIGKGELICGYCRTDVRSVVEVPLVVSRLELY